MHHSQGEHSEENDILKQVERLLRSLPEDENEVVERVSETFREVLAELGESAEEAPAAFRKVMDWFLETQLPPAAAAAVDRRELGLRVEALIEAVIEAGLVDMGGNGVVLDEIMLERPRVLDVQREGEWLDLRLADEQVAVTVAIHNCLDLAHLVQSLDEVARETIALRDNRVVRQRPRMVARAEAHYWAIWPGEDRLAELVFAETEMTEADAGERRVRLVMSREEAKSLAAALKMAL